MTLAYSVYLVTVRVVTALLLLPIVVAFVVVTFYGSGWVDYVACVVAALSITGLWVQSSLPSTQTLVRTGVYPLCCSSFPRTEKQLRMRVRWAVEKFGQPPTIIGSGWSFFLNRRAPGANSIYIQNLSSRIGEFEWLAGATVGQVCEELRAMNLTLSSRPTLDDTTLGSWISANGHGNASTLAGGANATFKEVRVLDMLSDSVLVAPGSAVKELFEGEGAYKYCVLSCKLKVVYDGVVQMKGTKIEDAESAAEWLAPTSQLRVMFVGAARDYGLGIVWQQKTEAELQRASHVNPHFASRVCFYLQVDICSVVCGWHESLKKYDGFSRLSDANRWSYWGWPLGIGLAQLGIVCAGLHNFEIFYVKDGVDGVYLWDLTQSLVNMHHRVGGRTEIRVATEGAMNICHLDCSLHVSKSRLVFDLLYDMGVREAALHRGKRVDEVDGGRVSLVPVSALFHTSV